MEFIILYGALNNYVDVTEIVKNKLCKDGLITIPKGDFNRFKNFGIDPCIGVVKEVLLKKGEDKLIIRHDESFTIPVYYRGKFEDICTLGRRRKLWWWVNYGKNIEDPEKRLLTLHRFIDNPYGEIKDEYPEQLMTIKHLSPDAKVLEIGGNIGRNSCVIGMILKDDSNLVVLECGKEYVNQLRDVKSRNGYNFNIEPYALSKRKLAQRQWTTFPYEGELPPMCDDVPTITWETLREKYGTFDTLVADCEGALYYILKDWPEIMDTINMVIIENDFTVADHRKFVENVFIERGLKLILSEPLLGGDGARWVEGFYQVWKK
jgi:hypothetical protein